MRYSFSFPIPYSPFPKTLNYVPHQYEKCYIQEVERVLKPGGIFSWADLRPVSDLESLENSFNNSRLTKIKQATITPNVLKALELVNEPKQSLINNYVPPFLKTAFQEFAAVKDSRMYQAFQTGQMIYLSYIFQKPKTD
jgi:hypothetical protein